MIHAVIEWMGTAFSPEQYVFWTRIQCTVWTLADLVIVFYLLRIGDWARGATGLERHRISYVIWAATLPPAAAIPFQTSGDVIFLLEILVTAPHFLIIVYVLIADSHAFIAALARLAAR